MKTWTIDELENIFGFKRMNRYEVFVDAWNVIGDRYEIVDREVIIDDEVWDKAQEIGKKLYKPIFTYNSNYFYSSRKEHNAREAKRKLQQEQKEEQERQSREKLQILKNSFSGKWRDFNWIDKNIGEYCTKVDYIQYYWSIIGDNYRKVDWKGDILIDKEIYDIIYKDKRFKDFSGRTFLGRTFKVNGQWSHNIVGTYDSTKEEKSILLGGVYGIYEDDELVYIGSTGRSFDVRIQEHQENIKNNSRELYLYQKIDKTKQITFKRLIEVKDLKVEGNITLRDIESMELALINLYKPKYNLAGNVVNFRYME